jgi:hypothetical protein
MYQNKKRVLHLFIGLFMICCYSLAQNQSSDVNSLKEGAWALQFGISSNFTLTSFQGTTFSIKYQLSDKSAIRGGISISGSSNNGTGTVSGTNADTSIGSLPTNSSSSSQVISFTLQYLWYTNPSGPIHFYIGLGPVVSYSYSRSNSPNSYDGGNYMYVYAQSSSSTQWGAGGSGSVGVEWFPSQWFSLRAEYGESLQYRWGSNTSMTDYTSINNNVPYHSNNSGTTKGWLLSSSSVSFGLNVYW